MTKPSKCWTYKEAELAELEREWARQAQIRKPIKHTYLSRSQRAFYLYVDPPNWGFVMFVRFLVNTVRDWMTGRWSRTKVIERL